MATRGNDDERDEKGLLWRVVQYVVEGLDTPGVEGKVAALRTAHPTWTDDEIVTHLTRENAVWSGLVGGLTSLPANIPIVGTLATLTLGTAMDLAALLRNQCLLIVEVGAVHGKLGGRFQCMIDILSVLSAVAGDRTARRDLERIRVSAVGDRCLTQGTRQLLNKIATRIGLRLVQKSSARAIPVIGALVGAGINYAAIAEVGRTARRYYTSRGSGH